jgi:hypothetical protein
MRLRIGDMLILALGHMNKVPWHCVVTSRQKRQAGSKIIQGHKRAWIGRAEKGE